MRVLVNIRGCNGAGKSTIPMSMMDDPEMFVQDLFWSNGKRRSSITVFPSYGWVALGTYFNKTGGMDTLRTNEDTKATLYAALCLFPDYDVLMEGIMASTIFSSYADLFKEVEAAYEGDLKVIVLSLLPPVDTAISRVYKRNGGKPIREDLVAGKWASVSRSAKKFADAGFTSIRVDSSKVKKKHMLRAFINTINKRKEKALGEETDNG